MRDENNQTWVGIATNDLKPKSSSHLARLVFGSIMLTLGSVVIILHYVVGENDWTKTELILVLSLIGGAVGVVFTGTLISILKAVNPFYRGG